MKKQDIKAGILYGYAKGTSEYRNASPVIVLDAEGLWTWHRSSGRERRQWKTSNAKRFTSPAYYSGYRGDEGYLILSGNLFGTEEERAQILVTMKELYAGFAATPGNPDAVNELARKVGEIENIHLDVVNNRWIVGDYEAAKAEEAQRSQDRRDQHKAERDRAAAEQEFMSEAAEIIAAQIERSGVSVMRDYNYPGRVSLRVEDLAAFLGIKTPSQRL